MQTFFYYIFFEDLQSVMQVFPLLVLQATALLGTIATALFFMDKHGLTPGDSSTIGILLGLSSFILSALTIVWGQYPVKFFLTTDCLFLAGFIGGWRNAMWAACFTILSRICFGEMTNFGFAVFDTLFIAFSSALLKSYIANSRLQEGTVVWFINLLVWRLLIVATPLMLLYGVSPLIRGIAQELLVGRAIGAVSFSALIIIVASVMIRQAQRRTQRIYIDSFSRLPNIRALQKDIEDLFSKDKKKPRILLVLDINNMHDMILELGHAWADVFSQRMGETLTAVAGEPWLAKYFPSLYCYSERAFIIILEGVRTHEVSHKGIISKIYNRLIASDNLHRGSIKMWLTLGVFDVLPRHINNPSHLLRALSLVYRSDVPIQYFHPNMSRQLHQEVQLRKNIEEWIQNKCVPLWLQPKVSLKESYCTGSEALLRVWGDNNTARYISPPTVFSIAARHRLTEALEWATVETIVSYLNQIPSELHSLVFSLNISPSTLTQHKFGKKLCLLLASNNIAGHRLTLEIIETDRLPEADERVKENIAIIREAGIGLSLDDFGTGYASISLLSQFPFTELKLDYSMISNMDDERVFAAVALSIESANRYNAVVVAEGVETVKQQQELQHIGIELGQGYLFGKAMPLQDFIQYAQANSFAARASAGKSEGCIEQNAELIEEYCLVAT